jgi:hypothetical protein
MRTTKTTRWLALVLAVIMIVSLVPMSALAAGSVTEYPAFLSALKVLEGYADEYAAISGKDAGELTINFIRTGVERYNDGNWKTLAGEEIVGFTSYVEEQDAINGTNAMDLRDIVIDDFYLPNGDWTDFGHMFGTMNIAYIAATASADLGGWAGDLCDLLYFSKNYGNVPAGSVEQMADYIRTNCFGVDADDAFGMDDFYADLDAFYLVSKFKGGSQKLSTLMEGYFTASLTDADRAAYFLNTRFKGLNDQEDVRSAILGTYTANVGLKVLEADRGLSDADDLRTACCYAFADYLYELAEGRLEGGSGEEEEESPYYSVFSSLESVLAPGISQTINYATTADGKQIVYYVATVDVNRDDVTIMANYKDNNPGGGWGMQRVEDQANALLNNYKNKYEHFNVIVATNGDGYNMSTGKPGGLLVMNGVEWNPVDGDGFFAILKDGSAMIGTQAQYAQYKTQIQDAIGGFGATLIRNGQIVVKKSANHTSSRASRTAVGITAEGKVIMMVLDGRQEPFSTGGSMEEIAQIMLDAGCVNAVNLDGGGSSTYLSKPAGSDKLQLVSRPSDGYARSVATSLVAVSTAKSSKEFDHANITSDFDYLTVGTQLKLTATGVSNTGNAAAIPAGAVWQVSDANVGSVSEDGIFTALDNGEVEISLMANGVAVGSKKLYVVLPDMVAFTKDTMNIVMGVPTEIPLEITFEGNPVAYNPDDVFLFPEYDDIAWFDGTVLTVLENNRVRSMPIYVILNSNEYYTEMSVTLYAPGEAYFDFEKATAGNRTLAWLREINNTKTEDNLLYQIVEPGNGVDMNYTFALDMSSFEIPEQLQDITYMLPGADQGFGAWEFLLSLAERVSVLSEVKVIAQFSPNVEVDLSGLKVSCDLFYMDSAVLDENNQLTITAKWVDRTQAIDPASISSTCILSGIKMSLKDGASWDKDQQLIVRNTGKVTYSIYLRASSLYSFACSPNNQEKYGLLPFVNPDVIVGGKEEAGAYFESEYVSFEDTFILDKTNRNGWVGSDFYYVDNEAVTGLQYLPTPEDESVKKYYLFDENGKCKGLYTGLIEEGSSVKYALAGVLQKGWQSVVEQSGESYYYYFSPYTYAAVGAGEGWITVENYQYYFVNYRCMKGKVVKTSKGYQYRFAGNWQRNQWVEQDGAWYYIERQYVALSSGFHWVRTIDGSASACYLFGEDAKLRSDLSGLYHVGNDTYLVEEGKRVEEAGLVFVDGYYYYFGANAKAVKNRTYWPSKTNGLLPMGPYKFDEQGRMVNPPVTPDPEPGQPDTPDTPDVPDTPVEPEKPKRNGIVNVGGVLYYYKNDIIQYAAGLIKLEDGNYIYVRSNGQLAIGNYWVTTNNDLLPVAMYTFGNDGMMVVEGQEPEQPETPDTPVVPEVKNGILEVKGVLYYYENNAIKYCAGLVKLEDGSYIYVRSNGMLAIGDYWITNNNGLLPVKTYTFGADGKLVIKTEPEQPETPETPETPDTPVVPEVKNGILEVGGKLYYYKNDAVQYNAGLLKLTDDNGVEFYIYVRSNGQLATGVYWPTNHNDLLPYKGYDFGTDGRLYL